MIISETDKAYLAGLVDGEGCIMISHNKAARAYMLRVSITNTYLPVLEMVQRWFGGCIQKGTVVGNRKQCYSLWLAMKPAQRLLEQVGSYLIIKRPQAEIAFRFLKTLDTNMDERCSNLRRDSKGVFRRTLSLEVINERMLCRAELKKLNMRGVIPPVA